MSKILIVEDEESIAELEKDYLELSGFEVEIENDGSSGLDKALKEDYDLLILDLMLPGTDGFEICKRVREVKNTPIIMVSAKKEDIDKIRGLGLGADDYITKPFSPSEMVARVKAHMARYERLIGSGQPANELIEIRGLKIDKTARRVWVNGEEKTFTTKEFDLLTFLAQNPNHVFTKEELFSKIWDMESIGDIEMCIRDRGVTEDAKSTVYLRPETAQGIFVNFKNVQRTSRKKVPFGIGQIGKSFRNEITPGNFTFRTREFEQMELEFFCKPDTDLEWFAYWKEFCINWLRSLGIKDDELRARDHSPEELSFYSKATTDLEYLFPFGWGELWGIADRTDYDLSQHQKVSGQDMSYFDDETKERYIPYVIEPSLGADRVTLAFLCAAYDEEEIGEGDVRTVLHFHPAIAPVKVGVLPLSKKLNEGAEKIYTELSKYFNCEFDDRGNIGKRYRRQDEIGTPFCITYDFDSEEDHAVTVRDRDTMEQVRVPIAELKDYFAEKFMF